MYRQHSDKEKNCSEEMQSHDFFGLKNKLFSVNIFLKNEGMYAKIQAFKYSKFQDTL